VNHHLFRALLEAACLACEEVCDYRRLGARRVSDADAALFRETAQLIERLNHLAHEITEPEEEGNADA
jgi:hypothetical protein